MVKKKPGIKGELNSKVRKITRDEMKEKISHLLATVNPTVPPADEDAGMREALARLKGVPGVPYANALEHVAAVASGELAVELSNPLVVYSDGDIKDAAKLLRDMPVPSMMTAIFNTQLPPAGDPGRQKNFIFGDVSVGKSHLVKMLHPDATVIDMGAKDSDVRAAIRPPNHRKPKG